MFHTWPQIAVSSLWPLNWTKNPSESYSPEEKEQPDKRFLPMPRDRPEHLTCC